MFLIDILYEIYILFIEMAPYMLLGLFFVGILDLFVKREFILKHVGGNTYSSIAKAAFFGIPLPLCSCGVIPTSVYMAKSGASKGSVISFLISTPQTGIDSIVATYGMMGWVFAIFRPAAALIMGIIGGAAVKLAGFKEKIKPLDKYGSGESAADMEIKGFFPMSKRFYKYSFAEFLDGISVQFIIGLAVSGLIAYFVPDNFFAGSTLVQGLWGMLLIIVIGIPMYVCATASIPIAVTLLTKGFSPGIAFVFLVVGPATNAASLTILLKVLGKKVTMLYLLVVSVLAVLFGLLLDRIFLMLNLSPFDFINVAHEHAHETDWWQLFLGGIFLIFLVMSIYRLYLKKYFKSGDIKMENEGKKTIKVEGMDCKHCVMNVSNAISGVSGVKSVDVSLEEGAAFVGGEFDFSEIKQAVEDVGYKVKEDAFAKSQTYG